jgi:putative adhesin
MTFRNSTHEGVRHVVLDNLGHGTVTVEPGVQPHLVECSINAGQEEFLNAVQVRQERDWLRISFPVRTFRNTNAHLRLGVPPDLEYVIKVGSADVSVSADMGRSKISSGSGSISVGRTRDLETTTGSGDVSAGEVGGSGTRLASGSGDITVAEARCPVVAKSGSGDVTIKRAYHPVQASSGSGDITVAATSAPVELRTASGSLTVGVADDLPAWVDLDSSSGEVRIAMESTHQPPPGQAYVSVRATTASGDIAVYRA